MEGAEDGVEDLLGWPPGDLVAAVQQHFQQADDAGVLDLTAGMANGADGEGHSDALEQWEVDVHVQPLGLEGGEAVGDGQESLPDRREVIQPLL